MTIEQLYTLYQAHPVVTTDTRQCEPNALFFALKGASFDGNQFAASALQAGCAYTVVDDPTCVPEGDHRYILVEDVLQTLQALAAYHRQQLGIPVLQITGTNGKTTTKELVSAVLSKRYNTLFTEGNLNNHIGVPRTLLRIRPEHEVAVIETGANHPGEIAFLCGMVQADYGLISNVGRAHLEGFGSFEGVKRTKGELYDDLKQRGKTIFLNGYDDTLREMAEERGFSLVVNEGRLPTAIPRSGAMAGCAIPYVEGRVEDCSAYLVVQWRAHDYAPWHTIHTHLVGAYNLDNIRAAITVGLNFGVGEEPINEALSAYQPTNSRSEWRDTGRNRLIVDAYNANPTSMQAALDNFEQVQADNKMVILGMMGELGADSLQEHQRIVERVASLSLQKVWLVGAEFQRLGVVREGWSVFANVEEVQQALADKPLQDYTILIKGSNSTRLYQLPDSL